MTKHGLISLRLLIMFPTSIIYLLLYIYIYVYHAILLCQKNYFDLVFNNYKL